MNEPSILTSAQLYVRVLPTSDAINEPVNLTRKVFDRVFRLVPRISATAVSLCRVHICARGESITSMESLMASLEKEL